MNISWLSKIEISWKLGKKGDFRKFLDPFWGFTLKTVPGFRDSPHFVIAFGTKNHEMWGPPVITYLSQGNLIGLDFSALVYTTRRNCGKQKIFFICWVFFTGNVLSKCRICKPRLSRPV